MNDELPKINPNPTREQIIKANKPCITRPNGTGQRCTCGFNCANYCLRAYGYKDLPLDSPPDCGVESGT